MRTDTSMMLLVPLLCGVVTWSPALSWGQTDTPGSIDLVLGKWSLNLEASTFSPGPAPKRQERVYTADLDGMATKVTTVDARGKEATISYVADYDSLEYTVSGSSRVDTIVLTKVNAFTATATLRHASKTIGTARRAISKDGKKMTITFEGSGADGRPVRNVAVYDRKSVP